MPMSKPPLTCFANKILVINKPNKVNNTAGSFILPNVTKVALSETIMCAFLKPMKATNKPIPTPIDVFSTCGIPSTILLRTLVTVKITNTVPEIKTAPNAVCQLSPIAPQIVYEKNALRPRPGATITGTLATKPISIVAKAVVKITAATVLS